MSSPPCLRDDLVAQAWHIKFFPHSLVACAYVARFVFVSVAHVGTGLMHRWHTQAWICVPSSLSNPI